MPTTRTTSICQWTARSAKPRVASSGASQPPAPFDDQHFALHSQSIKGAIQHGEVDVDSGLLGRDMRRDGRLEGIGIHLGIAGAHIHRGEQRQRIVIAQAVRRELQPEATGFIAATRVPRAAKARHRAAAMRVLPTPVSVPVTNKACGVIGRRRERSCCLMSSSETVAPVRTAAPAPAPPGAQAWPKTTS